MSTFVSLVPGAVASDVQSRAKGLASSCTVGKLYRKYNLVPSERGRWGEGGLGALSPEMRNVASPKVSWKLPLNFNPQYFVGLDQ